jgi:hypothetical protein
VTDRGQDLVPVLQPYTLEVIGHPLRPDALAARGRTHHLDANSGF